MRIPHTISRNVIETYRCSAETLGLPNEGERRIRAEDDSWDEDIIPELRTLALRVLVTTWRDNPILEELPSCIDRDVLVETLPTDLPLELVITRITDEHYWERSAKDRWQYNDPGEHGNSWRRVYCECHCSEYLENLEPSYFQQEECEKVINLVKDHVHTINLRSLLPTKKPIRRLDDEDGDPCVLEEDIAHHIPLAIILPQFPHLCEISLNFGVIYMNDGFEWRDFVFSVEDSISLGEGIRSCPKLQRFSVTRSNLDQSRAAAILQGVINNDSIVEINFSHCKLGDSGAHAIGEFLSMHKNLTTLHLIDNNIGPKGLAGITCGILKNDHSTLKHLNLRLNPFHHEGISHICALLLRNGTLEILNISGCEFDDQSGIELADILGSGYVKLSSLIIDLSNNDFGPAAGRAFEKAIKSTPYIIGLDIRMCNFLKESEKFIYEMVSRYKVERKKDKSGMLVNRAHNKHTLDVRESVQQQKEVDTSSARRKDILDRMGLEIKEEDIEIMKSILQSHNMAQSKPEDAKVSHSNVGNLKTEFGNEISTQQSKTNGVYQTSSSKIKDLSRHESSESV